jgi:hypothetical protein
MQNSLFLEPDINPIAFESLINTNSRESKNKKNSWSGCDACNLRQRRAEQVAYSRLLIKQLLISLMHQS